jgi:hypothetical protein
VIPTQVGAKTGALDPRDGRIYLPTATLATPEPGAKRASRARQLCHPRCLARRVTSCFKEYFP